MERNQKGQFVEKSVPWNKGTKGVMKTNFNRQDWIDYYQERL